MENRLKRLWAAGKPTINGWCSIGSPFTAEIMAAQGYDSLTVDLQHGALDYADALGMLQAIHGYGCVPMARVPWREPGIVMKMLDAGAMGIICPMINTPEEAEELVSFVRYPPLGRRSSGPTRASFVMPGYSLAVNDEIVVFAMIETAEGMANLDDILAVPGLDGVYVGPSDLSIGLSNGALQPGMDRQEPEMVTAIQKVASSAKAAGLRAGLHCATPEYAHQALGWGFNFTTVGGDARYLAAIAGAGVKKFRELTGTETPARPGL